MNDTHYYDYEVEAAYMPNEEDQEDLTAVLKENDRVLCISCKEPIDEDETVHDGQCNECWCNDEEISKVPRGVRYGNY